MGGANVKAVDTVNTMIQAGVSVVNSVNQKCLPSVQNFSDIQIVAENGAVININEIDLSQIVQLNSQCFSSAQISTQVSQDIQNQIAQVASSTAGLLNWGSADAENFISNSYNLSQDISNTFFQKCSPVASNTSTIGIEAKGTGSVINVGYLSLKQANDVTSNCVQNVVANSTAAQNLEQIINQSATAKAEGLGDILKWILIILVVGGVVILIVMIFTAILKAGGGAIGAATGGGAPKIELTAPRGGAGPSAK